LKKVSPELSDLSSALHPEDDIDLEIPFSDELAKLSRQIAEEVSEIDTSNLEKAGRLSTAILLNMGATGKLNKPQFFTFLKTLADKKTPAPVQRIEQRTELDMQVIIANVIQSNPKVLQASIEKAALGRKEVMDRWGMDNGLSLPTTDDESSPPPLPVGEPKEIDDIRKDGGRDDA